MGEQGWPVRLAVVGLWHLGCVMAASWARLGHSVSGYDPRAEVIAGLREGSAPLFEPGLDEALLELQAQGQLSFTSDLAQAVGPADVIFLGLDTPVDDQDRSDLTQLDQFIEQLAPLLIPSALLVVSSQVPVGTCGRWRDLLRAVQPGVELVCSPENLRLGNALEGYLRPDRVVIGADDPVASARAQELFAPTGAPLLTMSLASAEMSKHALNAFLATSISFVNEIADTCEATGADVLAVVGALKSDPRIGARAFLTPGLGFAGGTLARDIQALREARPGTPLLDGVLAVNRARREQILRRLQSRVTLAGARIAVLGLAYKPGTSTLRRSVALEIIDSLQAAGAQVVAYDPKADLGELDEPPSFETAPDPYTAATGAQALVLVTEWPEFAGLDFARLRSVMARPLLMDTRNMLAGLDLEGFEYLGVGR